MEVSSDCYVCFYKYSCWMRWRRRHNDAHHADVYEYARDGGGGKCHADVERYAEWKYQYCGYCDALGPVWRDECPADLAAGRGVSRRVGSTARRIGFANGRGGKSGWNLRHSQCAGGLCVVAGGTGRVLLDCRKRF